MTVTYRLARNEQNEDAHMIVGSWHVACDGSSNELDKRSDKIGRITLAAPSLAGDLQS